MVKNKTKKPAKTNNNCHICELEPEEDEVDILFRKGSIFGRCCYYFHKFHIINENNYFSRKYLGSKAAIKKERNRQIKNYFFIVHPFSKLRTVFECFMIFGYCFQFFMIPLAAISYKQDIPVQVYTCYTIYFIDIVMNFMSGYYKPESNEIVLSYRRVTWNYLRTYFIIDLIVCFPSYDVYRFLKYKWKLALSIIAICKYLKFFRMITLYKFMRNITEMFNVSTVTFHYTAIALFAVIYIHTTGCFVYTITVLEETYLHKKTKTQYQSYFLLFFRGSSIATGADFYILDLHNYLEVFICCLMGWLSQALFFVFVAIIMQTEQVRNSSQSKFLLMENQTQEYLTHKQLPHSLKRRVKKYYEFRYQNSYFREDEILNCVSGQLRHEVVMHSCRQLVENVIFFKQLPFSLLVRIVSCLNFETFLANDIIIRADTVGNSMYFIASGTVAIYTKSGKEVCHLEDGAYFGEIALVLREEKHMASVIAVEACDLYRLERKDFERAIRPFPDLFENIQYIATERMERTIMLDEQNRRRLAARKE